MTGDLVMLCDVDLDVPDGARTHTVEVARGFARAGLGVHLVARGGDPQLDGVRFEAARGEESERALRGASLSARSLAVIWRERRRARRCYVRYKWSTMPALVVARLLGYRVVTEVNDYAYGPGYGGESRRYVDRFKVTMTILMGRLSHGVVAGTEEAKQLLTVEFHVPPQRIAVVPIGVDVDYFRPLDREEAIARAGLDPAQRYVTFMGRFAGWVDFDTLLEAFVLLAAEHPDVRLLLIGDGDERAHIEAEAGRLGISARLIVTGFVRDRDRVRDLLGSASVLVASHKPEHLDRIGMNATKLAEYLACGRPIVARDVARIREMIADTGAGFVVPGEPHAMARALASALDPETARELGAAGRRLAIETYSWDSTIRQTLLLFEAGEAR